MMSSRKVLFVSACALALAQACSSGTELNPQPLPPVTGGATDPGPFGGSSSGASGETPSDSSDAGTTPRDGDADAGDADAGEADASDAAHD
ncbi:MAG: hypothetical protein JWP97_1344 [Labilithrix sp.]|nr:hypothetical protein [Labilithrix sp.]